ncbi:hypothetical protein M409DRAFT_62886 [Zasmidium cellare ATCC 36951]|uniref:Polyprenal reductase n=1 Tax=Zasmidium cellare ATCC 36951 TaxID=1080233 RepID=A0A6A6CXW1_ZASCE|nr:uncharacterized protein M409DRAFT_62886 [Zasmidium cellare ATCC 36951]KAF2172067.1 hypothetical protein M409DRAFT_62886 [Zasmidium cellare ATCC 36951]
MDAIVLLRSAYLGAAGLVLFVFAVPALRLRFLDYGPRSTGTEKKYDTRVEKQGVSEGAVGTLLDKLAELRVPHSWFTSFYAVSVTLSLFWAAELLVGGPSFQAIAQHVPSTDLSMSFSQVLVVWIMMLGQGSRRLYECMAISKPSESRMWFGHWALGILFYILTSVAVWIEGIPAIRNHTPSTQDFLIQGPSARTFISILIFLLASGFQHDCHAYLASLKESKKPDGGAATSHYRLPEHPAFSISLTPHYFAECLIYLSLAIAATPKGGLMNWTLVTALVFVMANLGVTAYGTGQWYERKFGSDAVKGKARMIPLVF